MFFLFRFGVIFTPIQVQPFLSSLFFIYVTLYKEEKRNGNGRFIHMQCNICFFLMHTVACYFLKYAHGFLRLFKLLANGEFLCMTSDGVSCVGLCTLLTSW